jgi:hypothetical protein
MNVDSDENLGNEIFVQCQTCGNLYTRIQVELAKIVLLGYDEGKCITSCIRCSDNPQLLSKVCKNEV